MIRREGGGGEREGEGGPGEWKNDEWKLNEILRRKSFTTKILKCMIMN